VFHDPNLVGCWPTLTARLDTCAVVARWSRTEPELASIDDVTALLAAWAEPASTHRVGDALVRLSAADGAADDDALMLLLHLLSGVVHRLTNQLRDLSPDVTDIVLSELTCQIRSYHWRTRRGGLATNLERDTRRGVLADLRPSDRYHPELVERVTWDGNVNATAWDTQSRGDSSELDLIDILTLAAAIGIDSTDLSMLADYECGLGQRGPAMYDVIARKYGISRRTLYRRRRRTLTALRAAAPNYLAAVA
jgi:hypothetical protein